MTRRTNIAARPTAANTQVANGGFAGAPGEGNKKVTFGQATVYNWVELVYKAFHRVLPVNAKEVALLGVREATFAGAAEGKDATDYEEKAAEGEDDAVADATRESGIRRDGPLLDKKGRPVLDAAGQPRTTPDNPVANVFYNDQLFLVWTEDDVAKSQRVEVFRCTLDAGRVGSVSSGMPIQMEGWAYLCAPTAHIAKKYGNKKQALKVRNVGGSGAAFLRLVRDATKKSSILTNVQSAFTPVGENGAPPEWLFCTEEMDRGIHIHFARSDKKTVDGNSIGCTALAHAIDSERYTKDFYKRCADAPNAEEIPYLVVSSKYVKNYDTWQAERQGATGAAKPEDILKKEALEPMPEHPGTYLQSFVSKGFVEQVLAAAKQLEEGTYPKIPAAQQATRAARLRTSLANMAMRVAMGETGGK